MDETVRIKNLIDDGEYLPAMGISDFAGRMEMEISVARLSQENPDLGGALSGIIQVVTDKTKKEIYDIACEFRDDVIDSLICDHGEDILQWLPNYRSWIWTNCQRLLRCDFEKGDVKIGPIAAASLAEHGREWILEELLNAYLLVLNPEDHERRSGYATRGFVTVECQKCGSTRYVSCAACDGTGSLQSDTDERDIFTLVDDLSLTDFGFSKEPCAVCDGGGSVNCDCSDDYTFEIPRGAVPGSVLAGIGERTNKIFYVILDRKVVSPRPLLALFTVYGFYNFGQNFAWAGEDYTLEDAEAQIAFGRRIVIVVGLILGTLIGKVFGSWLVGAICTLPLPLISFIYHRYFFPEKMPIIFRVASLLAPLILGLISGYFIASWQIGLLIGGVSFAVLLVFALISNLFQSKAFR